MAKLNVSSCDIMTCSNLRLYIDCIAKLQACRRDKQIEQLGLCVTAMVPINELGEEVENEVNFYGDPCIHNRKDKVMWIVPNYKDYYSLLSIVGEDLENPLPLECQVKTTEHWPRETIFKLPVLHSNGELIDRYWKVINQEGKHLEVYYDKKLLAVPARDHELEGII